VRHLTIFLCSLLLLSACSQMLNFTPERAAIQEVLRSSEANLPVDPDSVQVLQTLAQGENTLVLVAFQRERATALPDECLFMYEMHRSVLGWVAGSGGGGCGPIGGGGQPLDVGSGAHRSDELASSHVTGLVRDPLIASVEVTWDDGEVQQVPVVNGSYLAWREGVSSPVQVSGLDAQDQVIYTSDSPILAPGKETP